MRAISGLRLMPKSRTRVLLAGMLLIAGNCFGADGRDESLTTYRDFSIVQERDRPIRCKPGDIEGFPGQTMAQVFGAAWPTRPAAAASPAHSPAERLLPGRLVRPRGTEGQAGLVTVATLVDEQGQVLQVEPICMTSAIYAIAARRAAKTARYKPALIDGVPVISVAMHVYVFQPAATAAQRPTRR